MPVLAVILSMVAFPPPAALVFAEQSLWRGPLGLSLKSDTAAVAVLHSDQGVFAADVT